MNVFSLVWVIESNTLRSVSVVSLSFVETTNRFQVRWHEKMKHQYQRTPNRSMGVFFDENDLQIAFTYLVKDENDSSTGKTSQMPSRLFLRPWLINLTSPRHTPLWPLRGIKTYHTTTLHVIFSNSRCLKGVSPGRTPDGTSPVGMALRIFGQKIWILILNVPCDDPEDQLVRCFNWSEDRFIYTGNTSCRVARSHWCVCVSNSRLQTRCSWATGMILTLETWDREVFLISRVTVQCCSRPFCWQLQLDRNVAFLHTLSFLYFLRWTVSHVLFIYNCVVFPLSPN